MDDVEESDGENQENERPTTEGQFRERIDVLAQPRAVTNPRQKKTIVAFGRNSVRFVRCMVILYIFG